ncbi:hypothetical protein [Kribbella sp. HUAS MG21]|uniref:Uncharacterized protein n=1 Tax=Kribbella sp. HUAS MG21 TaxID=3160966 RepID=A0AAU7TL35_9ACTN
MTTEDHWVGNIGHLALADSALGALLTDILQALAQAAYPAPPAKVDVGLTTKQSVRKVERRAHSEPHLFPSQTGAWLLEVHEATELRNSILHAVAINRCANCGAASHFVHPRSGQHVDRTDEAIRNLTTQMLKLRERGIELAEEIAQRVNAQIVARARAAAEATNEIQNPPQVYPHRSVALCAECAGNGRGTITARLGTAIEIWPREKLRAEIERLKAEQATRSGETGNG